MNYTIRDLIMWRWCAATFLTSLLFSVIVAIFHPWNLALPQQAVWLVPPITPAWLVWPIANTIFVLIVIWNETNRFFLQPFWRQTRLKSYLRAFLQAWPLIAFSSTYSLPTLVVGSLALSVLVNAYFVSDFDALDQAYRKNNSYKEGVDSLRAYGIGSALIFFYTLVTFSGWTKLPTNAAPKQVATTFLLTPLIYLLVIIVAILAILLLIGLAEGLSRLLKAVQHDLWPLLRKIVGWILSLAISLFVALGLLVTLLCLAIAGLWKGVCWGTHWLLPAHQS